MQKRMVQKVHDFIEEQRATEEVRVTKIHVCELWSQFMYSACRETSADNNMNITFARVTPDCLRSGVCRNRSEIGQRGSLAT